MAKKTAWRGAPPTEYKKKLTGLVTIVTGEKQAKLVLQDDGKKFANGTDELKVPLADLPKHPRIQPNDKSAKEYRVRMNEDGDTVEALTPSKGHFSAKLKDLGKRPEEGADPVPYEKIYHEGQKDEERHLEFFAIYEITSGIFKGVEVPYYLHYKFVEDEENEGFTRYSFNTQNPKAKRGHQLREWMQAHGLEDELVPWDDDTILPILLERALEKDVEVELNFSKGYILSEGGVVVSDGYNEEAFGGDEEDVDEVEKEFPKKSVPAKEAKKPVKKISKKHDDEDEDL